MRKILLSLAFFTTLYGPSFGLLSAPAMAEEPLVHAIPYLTQRNRTGEATAGKFYGPKRGTLEAGYCDISKQALSFMAPLADAAPFHVPEAVLRIEAVRPAPLDQVLDSLAQSSVGRAPVLYTHGFFVDFEKGCRRASVLKANASLQGRFIWFSWPSDGDLLNYTRDEADLSWSVFDLAEVIVMLESRFGAGQIDLMGHSLGARGLAMAIYDLAAQEQDIQLGNVILLAPDIDFEVFSRMLPRIRQVVRSITVYVSDGDRPLALSEQVHGYPRLGQSGNDVGLLAGVQVIDLSDLPAQSPTGHLYHIYNAEVGDDIALKLNEGQDAQARRNLVRSSENLWYLRAKP